MHGRPRKAPTREDEAASAAKGKNLGFLQSQLLYNHHKNIYNEEALDLSAKTLQINPDLYTAWNYRKLAVQHKLAASHPDFNSIFDPELRLVESALRTNPKAYGAWYHREWVLRRLSKAHSSSSSSYLNDYLDHELQLLETLLKHDSRNFHAWNHRRFVAALFNTSDQEELKFTNEMIQDKQDNLSNYSMWHHRRVLLSGLLKKKAQGFSSKEKVLRDEYELVDGAIVAGTEDQSGWFYHLSLLEQTVNMDAPFLVSSWPSHGSHVLLSRNRCSDDCSLSQFDSFHSSSGTFPLILYFSEDVQGVNSSTITIESSFCTKNNLHWTPLMQNRSQFSQAWVTHIIFPGARPHSSEPYLLEISVGQSQGIISRNGFPYSHLTQFNFKVRLCLGETERGEVEDLDGDIILWKDENFHALQTESQEPHEAVSFDQLIINDVHEPNTSNWRAAIVSNEIDFFQTLLFCKIGILTLARLLTAKNVLLSQCTNKTVHSKVLELYKDLIKLDPLHSQYYKDQHSLVFLQEVTSNRESLQRHCCSYKNFASASIGNYKCVRLNNISLSRMGSVEKLLWVSMLDLSHNELCSIEGLEAMQLLSCLNLSVNKFSGFSALGPLRLLKSLEVLNISYNEIGLHTTDTTRYLCSSPLSHTEETSWNCDEIMPGGVSVMNYWEAFLIFKSLRLTQLDIAGNAIAGENFKSFLVKVVPSLQWLDGDKLR
ncbi:unnamed protein product [Prunus armeniaca]|uniref:Geranylgeranyl transferase type-2 subunit alpha n=1 Tax=Prunus armeniaca TaxID=36596 RepID=A0A6J5TIQ6_PRUAR|nr:unnamed protein product [Prunus armeniaca]